MVHPKLTTVNVYNNMALQYVQETVVSQGGRGGSVHVSCPSTQEYLQLWCFCRHSRATVGCHECTVQHSLGIAVDEALQCH